MAVNGIHHIGIAVRSIETQRPFYENTIGAEFESVEVVDDQKVRVAFFRLNEVRIELLEPTDQSSSVQRFLDKRGEGLHHLAFSVDDIQERINELQASGLEMVDEHPRPGSHQMQIAFVHPKSTHGVLMELCEPNANDQ